jgi:hypothetical protein
MEKWFKKLMTTIESLTDDEQGKFKDLVPLIRQSNEEYKDISAFQRKIKGEGFEKAEDVLGLAKQVKDLSLDNEKLKTIIDENKELKTKTSTSDEQIQKLAETVEALRDEIKQKEEDGQKAILEKDKLGFIGNLINSDNINKDLGHILKDYLSQDGRIKKIGDKFGFQSDNGIFMKESDVREALLNEDKYKAFRVKPETNRNKISGGNNQGLEDNPDDPFGIIEKHYS